MGVLSENWVADDIGGRGDSGFGGLLLSARGGLAPPSSDLGPSAPLVIGVDRLTLEFSSWPPGVERPLEGGSCIGEVGVFLPEDIGGPELVGGVRGAEGRPRPPRGPCSIDLLHWLSTSSFMLPISPRAAGSNPGTPGIKGCLKGPPSPGKLAGPPMKKKQNIYVKLHFVP